MFNLDEHIQIEANSVQSITNRKFSDDKYGRWAGISKSAKLGKVVRTQGIMLASKNLLFLLL